MSRTNAPMSLKLIPSTKTIRMGTIAMLFVALNLFFCATANAERIPSSIPSTSQIIRLYPAVCDTSKTTYWFTCTPKELDDVRKSLNDQLLIVISKYNQLATTNVELLCQPNMESWSVFSLVDLSSLDSSKRDGPCLMSYFYETTGKMNSLFFPCSNPNPRFEQAFPQEYWAGYYDSVNRSQLYGGCSKRFPSDVGLSYLFTNVWISRWSVIFPTYKSLITEYYKLNKQLADVKSSLQISATIPKHNPGDCAVDPSDPTRGFIAKGKTVVDRRGYKFTCINSVLKSTGKIPSKSTTPVAAPNKSSGQIKAVSIRCQDGNTFSNGCAVTWSNGSRSYVRNGQRLGSIVSGTDFYDMMGNHVCVDLYENGAAKSYNC